MLRIAANELGDWPIHFAGVRVDAKRLQEIADAAPTEPILRVLRENMRRPVDLEDFLLFLDDVLAAGKSGLRDQDVWVSSGRARSAGILIHPSDIWGRPRRYARKHRVINIDKPKRRVELPPAQEGDPLGPYWTALYRSPTEEGAMLAALEADSPSGTFASRIEELLTQLRSQGADAYLNASVRHRERGYLMWGAFYLSRAANLQQLEKRLQKVTALNAAWNLNVPIQWRHPQGEMMTLEAARRMSDAYDVVYATQRSAQRSRHYDAMAVDLSAVGLPRELTLHAPDGETATFDLGAYDHTRDLNLSPTVIAWIEEHFQMSKLKSDYPHWEDTAPPAPERSLHAEVRPEAVQHVMP
ncbi:MAG: hypothetical protein R3C68_10075 [Myxococcota bacterium]